MSGENFIDGVNNPALDKYTVGHDSAHVPFGDGSENDEYEIDLGMVPGDAGDYSIDGIEKSVFRKVPQGEHLLMVLTADFAGQPAGVIDSTVEQRRMPVPVTYYMPMPDGEARPFTVNCQKVCVTFCIPGDEKCTVRDYFTLPPASKSENDQAAYYQGYVFESEAKRVAEGGGDRSQAAQHYRQLVQFLGRLDPRFTVSPDTGRLPKVCGLLPNWIFYTDAGGNRTPLHRLIRAKVVHKENKKNPGQFFANIDRFSYAYHKPDGDLAQAIGSVGQVASTPAPEHAAPPSKGRKVRA